MFACQIGSDEDLEPEPESGILTGDLPLGWAVVRFLSISGLICAFISSIPEGR